MSEFHLVQDHWLPKTPICVLKNDRIAFEFECGEGDAVKKCGAVFTCDWTEASIIIRDECPGIEFRLSTNPISIEAVSSDWTAIRCGIFRHKCPRCHKLFESAADVPHNCSSVGWRKADDTEGLQSGDIVFCYIKVTQPFLAMATAYFNGKQLVAYTEYAEVAWWLSGVPEVPKEIVSQ